MSKATDLRFANIRTDQIRSHSTNVRRDLGDLRELCASIERHGFVHPVKVESHQGYWLLRDGHRRHAAATILGIQRMPAIIHADELEDDEWLCHAVQSNHHRRELDLADRRHTVHKMREAGLSWEGIAREFGVSVRTVQTWVRPQTQTSSTRTKRISGPALTGWVEAWRAAVARGDANVDDLLSALEHVASDGATTEHYPAGRHLKAS